MPRTHDVLGSGASLILLIVVCMAQQDVIRLVSNSPGNTRIGRIELYDDNSQQYHPVCDDYFYGSEAKVACAMLGYNIAGAQELREYGGDTGDFILDNVDCTGSEASLFDCQHNALFVDNCDASEAVGVACEIPDQLEDMPVRLVQPNGETAGALYGRLEVQVLGEWGTVCNDHFDQTAAQIVCDTLGQTEITAEMLSGYGGEYPGSGAIILDDVQCAGSEVKLQQCDRKDFFDHNCKHHEDVGVDCTGPTCPPGTTGLGGTEPCSPCTEGTYQDQSGQEICIPCPDDLLSKAGSMSVSDCQTIRLVGDSPTIGRIEMFHNDAWHTVCDDYFGKEEAKVACKQLGFSTSGAQHLRGFSSGDEETQIVLDNLKCSGHERDLWSCAHNGLYNHNCDHDEDISVSCIPEEHDADTPVRLSESGSGLLEIQIFGYWGYVCSEGFTIQEARVACAQLGFSEEPQILEMYGGVNSQSFLLEDISCDPSDPDITNLGHCTHSAYFTPGCDLSAAVGLVCDVPEPPTIAPPPPPPPPPPPQPSLSPIIPYFLLRNEARGEVACGAGAAVAGMTVNLVKDNFQLIAGAEFSVDGTVVSAAPELPSSPLVMSHITFSLLSVQITFTYDDLTFVMGDETVVWRWETVTPTERGFGGFRLQTYSPGPQQGQQDSQGPHSAGLPTPAAGDTIQISAVSPAVSLLVTRYEMQPGVKSVFLYLLDTNGYTEQVSGVLGITAGSTFTVSEVNGQSFITITRHGVADATLPVTQSTVYNPYVQQWTPCWKYTPALAEPL